MSDVETFVDEFQFLLVRLRDTKITSLPDNLKVFQFLLVRLRDNYGRSRGFKTRNISIPSGAIKRIKGAAVSDVNYRFQFLLVRLRVKNVAEINNVKFGFQFLLVRLRGFSVCALEGFFSLFQFLLVRLRVLRTREATQPASFQFLLVRLRAESYFYFVFPSSQISIPSGAIKRLSAPTAVF